MTTGGKFSMGVVPPMEKTVHVCGGMWAGRLLRHEGKGGRVVKAKRELSAARGRRSLVRRLSQG
jgi:hypothetical protein